MQLSKLAQRCDSAHATDSDGASAHTDMDQYRPMYGHSFHDNQPTAHLNHNRQGWHPSATAYQQQGRHSQHEAPQWEVDDRPWERSAAWDGEYGSAVGQGQQPGARQQGWKRDERWQASSGAQRQGDYGYNHGFSEGVHGFGQPAYATQGQVYSATYAQEGHFSDYAYPQEPAYYHQREWYGPTQAQEQTRQTSQDQYAQPYYYPQPGLFQLATQQQSLPHSCDYACEGQRLTQAWQTVNNAPYAINAPGFTAVNRPSQQQWNIPSVLSKRSRRQQRANERGRLSQNHHMYHTTAHGATSAPIPAIYQSPEEVPPPPPQDPRLTRKQKKQLLAQQQGTQSTPVLSQAEANWANSRRATASPKPPRLQVMARPEPKWSYIEQVDRPSVSLDSPRNLLVILDLNGTLLYRKNRGAAFTARPHVDKFLHYLLTNHHVMVWSSAQPENVNAMCEKLFNKQQMAQLVAVWSRKELRLEDRFYYQKVQVYKQLSWVWEDLAAAGKGEWDQSNTVLIDDSLEKAASEPHNLLQIEEFENRPAQQSTDVLGQVVRYLEVARDYSDVSSFMREYPFTYLPDDAPFDWTEIIADMH